MLRFFLKLADPPLVICDHNTETARLLHRNRHNRNRYISIIRFMEVQHDFIIHLINMVTGKNQYIFRIVVFHILKILVNRICRTGVPFAVRTLLIRRQYRHTSVIAIQIPRDADPDMCIQPQRLILCQDSDCINS